MVEGVIKNCLEDILREEIHKVTADKVRESPATLKTNLEEKAFSFLNEHMLDYGRKILRMEGRSCASSCWSRWAPFCSLLNWLMAGF